eukprot:augustus_masked-scaffold_12-processed-gene-8.10-mRNA-1 protein AED:0.26 eAED:0.37 QI:0/-1/0/1/-1/1/1/0/220
MEERFRNQRKFATLTSIPRPVRNTPNGFSANEPALIETEKLKFLITDSPSDQNMSSHLRNLEKYKVRHVCKAADTRYSTNKLEEKGIQVHDFAFPDGEAPPEEILKKWLSLVEEFFLKNGSPEKKQRKLKSYFSNPEVKGSTVEDLEDGARISVHCVAGLGRGPVLVAVALIEFGGLSATEAVELIRKHRRGAINKKQELWLMRYKSKNVSKKKVMCPIS